MGNGGNPGGGGGSAIGFPDACAAATAAMMALRSIDVGGGICGTGAW